jgi:DNA-binding transcriptional LysR family regulator
MVGTVPPSARDTARPPPAFSRRYPGIRLDLSLTDALVDLQHEQVDVAIRMGALADASFQAQPLGTSRLAVVASPAYVKARGRPRHPEDLAPHRCFNFRRARDEWPFVMEKLGTT